MKTELQIDIKNVIDAADPSFQNFLDALATQPDISEFSPSENRLRMKEIYKKPPLNAEMASILTFDEQIIENNHALPIRIYRSSQKIQPCLIWFHGGGFVLGDLDSSDFLCRKIAKEANVIVISVDYRLAPENKFPAAVEDAYRAVNWAIKNADKLNALNVNAEKILVGGVSAGATLAAVTCLMMRDRGLHAAIKHQLLMMPMIDNNFENDSYKKYGEGYSLTTKAVHYFLKHYVKNESDLQDPYCLPGKAKTYVNLPPAMVITLQCDPLCKEGEYYANQLKAEGNEVNYRCFPGLFHGFMSQVHCNDFAKNALDEMVTSYANIIQHLV